MNELIWKPNATVASVIEREGQFLMVKELSNNTVVYNQPAGHLDEGESIIAATARETLEETAWEFVPEALVGIYRWSHHQTGLTFLRFAFCGAIGAHHAQRRLDDGILDAVWLSYAQIQQYAMQGLLRSPLVLRCIDDYLAGIRYPLSIFTDVDAN